MPTTPIQTYSAHQLTPLIEGEDAPELAFAYAPSDAYPAGLAMSVITASGLVAAYDATHHDGTEVWGGLLNKYDVATDADGNITFGLQAGGGPHGEQRLTAPCYLAGTFHTQDTSGIDSAGAAAAFARILTGDLTNGIIRLG